MATVTIVWQISVVTINVNEAERLSETAFISSTFIKSSSNGGDKNIVK